jgi:hypothetical protein
MHLCAIDVERGVADDDDVARRRRRTPRALRAGERDRDERASIDVIVAVGPEREAAPEVEVSELYKRARLEVTGEKSRPDVRSRLECVEERLDPWKDAARAVARPCDFDPEIVDICRPDARDFRRSRPLNARSAR